MKMRSFLVALIAASSVFAQQPPERERGFKPDLVYQLSGLDSINLYNGNLNLSIPLSGTYPVGAGLSYSFALQYSGNVWEVREMEPKTQDPEAPIEGTLFYRFHTSDNAGPGWRLSFGELWPPVNTTPPYAGTAASMWHYKSPDASEHYFFDTLHEPKCSAEVTSDCDPVVAGVRYTRDGTYLRLVENGDARIVEFGDGQRHRFTYDATTLRWRLQYIYTAHSALDANGQPTSNYVMFEYPASTTHTGSNDWKITDSHGRTHYVRFQTGNSRIDKVEVAAFRRTGDLADVRATYELTYDNTSSAVDGTPVSFSRPCDNSEQPAQVTARMLERIDLPEGEKYLFQYRKPQTCDNDSATLTEVTLPTLGKIAWTYQTYFMMPDGVQHAIGVKDRSLIDRDGTILQKTRHIPSTDMTTVNRCASWANDTCTPEVQTLNYFVRGVQGAELALPYLRENRSFGTVNPDGSSESRRLSSETYFCVNGACGGTPERVSYLKYEMDAVNVNAAAGCSIDWPCARDRNRRVVSDRTVYPKDSGRYADTKRSEFDGLGHYRKETTDGNYTSGNVRTTYTNYNPELGQYRVTSNARVMGYTMLVASEPWILGTYTSTNVTEAGKTFQTDTCFDQTTGFLTHKRTLAGATAGAHDLLAVYTPDADSGYVATEEYLGGDQQTLGVTDLCSLALPAHDDSTFAIDHSYSYGVLATSQYSGAGFYSANNIVDANTGLVKESRDTAGLATTYDYDRQSRLASVTPPSGLAKTTYSFAPANGSTPAEVLATTGSGTASTSSKYQFDSIGRIWREHRKMPDATWSARETLYDVLGRRKSVSEFAIFGTSFNPSKTVYGSFDAFGRPGSITAPDGKETTFTYTGNRLTNRTQHVATAAGEVAVTTAEEVDRAGRLIAVTEDSGGANAVTEYKYDAANRLIKVEMKDGTVTQPRTFNYDGRGLLTSEQHPESGLTSYSYDARGHVTLRDDPVADVTTTYDDAERVLTITQSGVGTLKSFTYDTGGGSGLGKIATATRYNYSELGTVTIEEAFTYAASGGLLSRKDTTINGSETFYETYDYDPLGNVDEIGYPTCSGCPSRTIKPSYKYGSLTGVTPYTPVAVDITYHPNGAIKTIPHANAGGGSGPLYTQTITNDLPRPETITVSNFCDETNLRISAQPQPATVITGQPAGLTVQAAGATTYQWYSGSGASSTRLTGQTTSTLTLAVTENTTFWVRVGNGSCTLDSNEVQVTVQSCPVPDVTVTAPSSITSSMTGTAFVTETAGATYNWSISGGTITSGAATSSVMFRAGCSGSVSLSVTVTTSCTYNSGSASVPIEPFSVTLSGTTTIDQGQSTNLIAELIGAAPWTLTWSDGTTPQIANTSPAVHNVAPAGTTSYDVTVTDKYGCSGDRFGSAIITVKPPMPTNVIATASLSQASVSWAFTSSADSFDIYRGNTKIGTAAAAARSYVDNTVQTNTAYLYSVRAVKSGTRSDTSLHDLATTIAFTDDPLVPGSTTAKAVHLTELREALNAVRRAAGLANATFTGSIAEGVVIDAVHLEELGTLLNQARALLGLAGVPFTRRPLLGEILSAGDVTEIRGGVK